MLSRIVPSPTRRDKISPGALKTASGVIVATLLHESAACPLADLDAC